MCMNLQTEFGNKTHCQTNQPPPGGVCPASGDYTCNSGGTVCCPGTDAGGSGPWTCHVDDVGHLSCDRNPPPSGGSGWTCTTNPDGSQTCTTGDCHTLPSGEFGCNPGVPPLPPGPVPPGGWNCTGDEFHETCTSPPSGGGGSGGAG